MVLVRGVESGRITSDKLREILDKISDKREFFKAVGYLALYNAIRSRDYDAVWKLIKAYSKYVPEFKKLVDMYNTVENAYKMIQGYMNTLMECVSNGDVDCVSRIYNEDLQAIIPPAIDSARKLGLDTKPLEGVEWLTFGLLYGTKLIHDINNVLVNTPKISGNNPEQLSEQFMHRARFYSEAVQRIRSIIESYKPMIREAISHLKSLGLDYYKILENILDNADKLVKQLTAMEDIDVSVSKAFKGVSELENALWSLEQYGFDTAKPELVRGLLDLAGAIKELKAKASEYSSLEIAEANGSKTSIGEIARKYIDYFMHVLKNIVDNLAKTGDPRIIDVLKNNTLGLVSVPEGYEEKPVFKQIAEAVHYIIDANKKFFHTVQNMLLEGDVWAKPLLGLAVLGVIGSSLIDAFTMLFRPDELRQQISFLINGLHTLVTNPEGWVKGAWNIAKEMFATPYSALYTLSTLVALPLATEGLAEILGKKVPILRSLGDLLQGDPVGVTTRLLEVVKTTPKARLILRNTGIENELEAYLVGKGAPKKIKYLLSTNELDDMVLDYIRKNYSELAYVLGDELKRIRATNIPEYLHILRQLAEKKQAELLEAIARRSMLRRTVAEELRSLIGKKLEIALSKKFTKKLAEELAKQGVDYREAVASLERIRNALQDYIESLKKLGIDTTKIEGLARQLDRAIGDIIASTTNLGETLDTLRSSLMKYLEEASKPVNIDELRKVAVDTIAKIDNQLKAIITRIKEVEKELPVDMREDALEVYSALRILRQKIEELMKSAEADPVGTLLRLDTLVRNVLSEYKGVIDKIDLLSMHLQKSIKKALSSIAELEGISIAKTIDEGIVPQLLRIREIADQLHDTELAKQITKIADTLRTTPLEKLPETIDKILPELKNILEELSNRIRKAEKMLPSKASMILYALKTIEGMGKELKKLVEKSPLLNTLERYIDSFIVRARKELGVGIVNIEPTILGGILESMTEGLEYIRKLSPKLYDELKPLVTTLVEDLRHGRVLERDVQAIEKMLKILGKEPLVPDKLYNALSRIIEKVIPLTSDMKKLLSMAVAELERIEPIKNKVVFILGSVDEALARKIPLILADPDIVSRAKHLVTGEYEFKADGYIVRRVGQIGKNHARITYYVETPNGYWAKLVIDMEVEGNPLKAFLRGGKYKVKITKMIIYDPDNPVSREIALALEKDLERIERGEPPTILRDLDLSKHIYIPIGNGVLEPLKNLLVSAPTLVEFTRLPESLDTLRPFLHKLLRDYGELVFNINGKEIKITNDSQLDDLLDKLMKQGVKSSNISIELEGQATQTKQKTAQKTAQVQATKTLTATYQVSPVPLAPSTTMPAPVKPSSIVPVVNVRLTSGMGKEYEKLVL